MTINLVASGIDLAELATANGASFRMVQQALNESLYLAVPTGGGSTEPIEVDDLVETGRITAEALASEEIADFARLAVQLDDGEAATIALARHRGWTVATDDRKARRLASRLDPPVPLATTATIVHDWAVSAKPSSSGLASVLWSIQRKASFLPPRFEPLRSWWLDAAGDS